MKLLLWPKDKLKRRKKKISYKDSRWVSSGRHYPKGDNDAKETENVYDHQNTLNQRQLPYKKDIE